MIKIGVSILSALYLTLGFANAGSPNQKSTYAETKGLLRKMERRSSSKELRTLFEQGDRRMDDLIKALDDSEPDVGLNAQVVIKYLAAREGLNAIESWIQRQREQKLSYAETKIELLGDPPRLTGSIGGLAHLVLKNRSLLKAGMTQSKDLSAQTVCYNKTLKTALIEIVDGQIFTEGWHVVIRKESDGWHLISDSLVWQS